MLAKVSPLLHEPERMSSVFNFSSAKRKWLQTQKHSKGVLSKQACTRLEKGLFPSKLTIYCAQEITEHID